MRTLIKNLDIVTRDRVLESSTCVIEDGIISYVGDTPQVCDSYLDGGGGYLMPGFIDLHCHGGNGFDFMDSDVDGMKEITDFHLSHGTTTMLATTLRNISALPTQTSLKNLRKSIRVSCVSAPPPSLRVRLSSVARLASLA